MLRQSIILAGGEGTRLRPVTLEIPKPLVPVQGLPVLTWQVRWFTRYGVEQIIVTTPPKWRHAFERWRDGLKTSVQVELWEESEPMGTMGALVHHLHEKIGNEACFVTNGDELKGLDLKVLETFHAERLRSSSKYAATIALVSVSNPSDYGVAEMRENLIARFHEKPANPPSNFISSGLYILESKTLQEMDHQKKFLMFEKDFFPAMAEAERLGGCALEGPWFDCGTFERWERAIHEWQEPTIIS